MKRSNGEGTVWKKDNGKWVAQVTTPEGKRPSKVFDTQREAREWLTAQCRDMDTGEYVEPNDLTLGTWWVRWLKVNKGAVNYDKRDLSAGERFASSLVSKSSISSYDQSYKRIQRCCPELFVLRLSDLRRSDIQLAINELAVHYSDDTVRQSYIHIHDALTSAIVDKLIAKDPCNKILLPNRRDPEAGAKAMTEADFDAFVAHCLTLPRMTQKGIPDKRDTQRQVYKIAALTALSIGVRRGELCGLMWSDLRPGGISIERSLSDANEVTGPKNEQSAAEVPLEQEILDLINQLPRISEYIFAGPNGRPISPSTLYHWMIEHTKLVCSRPYTVHELRHTMITRAARRGVNPKVLQTISRHKRLETLLKNYTHVDESQRRDAVRAVNPLGSRVVDNTPKAGE